MTGQSSMLDMEKRRKVRGLMQADWQDAFEERAAILEYEAGMTRADAEAAARAGPVGSGDRPPRRMQPADRGQHPQEGHRMMSPTISPGSMLHLWQDSREAATYTPLIVETWK